MFKLNCWQNSFLRQAIKTQMLVWNGQACCILTSIRILHISKWSNSCFTCHAEELQYIVHAARVRHPRLHDRVEHLEPVRVRRTSHDPLTGSHEVDVPSQGVDLTIVGQVSECVRLDGESKQILLNECQYVYLKNYLSVPAVAKSIFDVH